MQQRQQLNPDSEEELSDYPGEEEDLGETGQLSPT